jgi:hypothetical protein
LTIRSARAVVSVVKKSGEAIRRKGYGITTTQTPSKTQVLLPHTTLDRYTCSSRGSARDHDLLCRISQHSYPKCTSTYYCISYDTSSHILRVASIRHNTTSTTCCLKHIHLITLERIGEVSTLLPSNLPPQTLSHPACIGCAT